MILSSRILAFFEKSNFLIFLYFVIIEDFLASGFRKTA